MRCRKTASIWLSRALAVLAAILYMAVVVPSIMPRGWPANQQLTVEANGRDPVVLGMHLIITAVPIACIWVGQRKSRAVESVGWACLGVLLLLACVA